jgi:hypothetical protein
MRTRLPPTQHRGSSAPRTKVGDATHALAEAQAKVAKAQAETIKQNSGVISARTRLANANRGVATAETQVANAAKALATAQSKADLAHSSIVAAGAGAAFLRAAHAFSAAFQAITGGGSDAILNGIIRAMQTMARGLAPLRGGFTRLGQVIGNAFAQVANLFASPVWVNFFNFLLRSATRIVPPLTQAFIALANIFRQIIRAAMPFLIRGLQQFRGLAHRDR